MSGRRSNGEGSPYRDQARGGWRGSIRLPDGSRPSVRGRTKAVVVEKLNELREQQPVAVTSRGSAPITRKLLLKDHLASWLADQVHRFEIGKLRPRTVEAYERCVRLYLTPILGDIPVKLLDVSDISTLHETMTTDGQGVSTVAQAQRTLGTALQVLVKAGRLGRNVAHLADAPALSTVEPPAALTRKQVELMAAAADPEDLAMDEARVVVGAIIGCRQSEAIGLQVTDIDLPRRQLRVERQRTRPAWRHGPDCPDPSAHTQGRCPVRIDGAATVARPKTRAGIRTVTIPERYVPVFEDHLKRLAARRGLLGDRLEDPTTPWLFPRAMGGKPAVRADSTAWAKLAKRACGANAPTGTHAARRHAATALAEAGVPLLTAAEILGWSGPGLAALYARISPEHRRDAMDRAWR